MVGGSGSDTFHFSSIWGRDVVEDFTSLDHLVFQGIGLPNLLIDVRDGSLVISSQENEVELMGVTELPLNIEFA
jgi:hypothetical protein